MNKALRARGTLSLVILFLLAADLAPARARMLARTAAVSHFTVPEIGKQPSAEMPSAEILTACSDLFISEYVEGTSNNKALEIYNPATSSISLSDYDVTVYFNGASTGTTFALTPSSSVAAGEVWLFCHSSASFAGSCDQTTGAGLWNGNDAIVLRKNGTVIDSIGQVGFDPGSQWGSGDVSTADNTIRRKAAIQDGDEDASDVFTDELAAEWDGYPVDTFAGLGSHTMNACGDIAPSVSTTDPASGAAGVMVNTNITIDFSEAVNVTGAWYTITCTSSGSHSASVSGILATWTLDPDSDFYLGESCIVALEADNITDQDADDPPDNMAADYSWSFMIAAADMPPSVASTTPANGVTGVSPGADLVVNFTENVDVAGGWYSIECVSSGSHSAVVSGGPQSFTLDPDTSFAELESCTVTIYAAQVTDQDVDDPPDNMAADHVWSFTVGMAGPPSCGEYTPIYTLQGSNAESSLIGDPVTTQGIVVGDFQNNAPGLGGFFLQDPWSDGNPSTSDGIFVYSTIYDVDVGDHVRLTGTVQEYGTAPNRLTEIANVTFLQECGSGYSIAPTAVTLPIPDGDALYLEKYEGMLITWPQTLHVTENYNLGRYGEVVLSSGGRLWQPTNVVAPGPLAVTLQAENDRNRIILDDDNLTQNADPIDHPSPGLTAANTLRSGDTVTGLTGCLSQGTSGYSGTDNYRVHPTVPPPFVHTNPRTAGPAAPGGTITVASFNVLNYFNGDGDGGGFPTSRGADTLEEFSRQRNKIIPAIAGLHADVIGLMEIENDSGNLQAIQDLVSGLNAMEGPGTYGLVNTGVIGTDEIRVALIYRPARVTPVGGYMVDYDGVNNRPTLAQTFEQNVTGERFSVVVNHFKSKGCTGATGADTDQGDGQGCYNDTRVRQATRLHAWINDIVIPGSGDDPDVVIIGDLNSYALEDPITTLTGFGYTNLVGQFEGLHTYSYVYMGQSGYLDHALATSSIVPQVAGTRHWHINPDEPYVLDYNMEYKSTTQHTTLYAADPYRSSDHDPVMIGLYPFDFSDLASSYGTAWHGGNGTLKLGSGWTVDPTFGPETDNATDDGLALDPGTRWEEGAMVRIYAQVTGGSGYLAGWFDWNADGDFDDVQERCVAQAVNEGANVIDLTIPTGAGYTTPGRDVTARLRLYPTEPGTLGTEMPTGDATGGEVEDSALTPPVATAVELARFEAIPAANAVHLRWETASELNTVGFHLYRSTSTMGEYTRLNSALIPAQSPGGLSHAIYDWLDATARPGATYYYRLEVVDLDGTSSLHGPVSGCALESYHYYLPLTQIFI